MRSQISFLSTSDTSAQIVNKGHQLTCNTSVSTDLWLYFWNISIFPQKFWLYFSKNLTFFLKDFDFFSQNFQKKEKKSQVSLISFCILLILAEWLFQINDVICWSTSLKKESKIGQPCDTENNKYKTCHYIQKNVIVI